MFSRKIFFTLIISLVSFQTLRAEYKVTEKCTQAWEALFNLDFITAHKLVQEELKVNPSNYYAYYVDQQIDAYFMMINASHSDYEHFEEQYKKRREIMDGKSTESPYYAMCEAEMQLQMGVFNVFFGDRLSGIRRAYSAYKKFYSAQKANPDFIYNRKMIGMFNIALSNLPPFAAWAAGTFGIKGDYDTGFNIMFQYFDDVKNMKGLNTEAALYITLGYKLNKEPEKAYLFLESVNENIIDYRLLKYFHGNTAWASGKNARAIELFSKFNPSELEIEFLPYNYMMGKIQMRSLDKQAETNLLVFLRKTKKEAYLKEINYYLALYYLMNGNLELFEKYKKTADDKGGDLTERDREAMYDCDLDYIPNPVLVKCRLLMDGGYYDRFNLTMKNFQLSEAKLLPYKLEYYLLMGKYYEAKNNNNSAIDSYKMVLSLGSSTDYYFASEAALRLGEYYEDKDKSLAKSYFEISLDLYDSDYYEYIVNLDSKGLERVD
ncbi:MAG TPA: hypothetical protein VIN10_04270 [Bacteroidales bacterium]